MANVAGRGIYRTYTFLYGIRKSKREKNLSVNVARYVEGGAGV